VDLGQAAAQQAPASHPVGELADAVLERRVHVVDDVGIEPYARHKQEVARDTATIAGHMTHRNAPRPALGEPLGGAHGIAAEAHLDTQHIGGAGGQQAQGDVAVHHALGHFVDGAIAAGREDEIRAGGNVFARDGAGGPRTARRGRHDLVPGPG